MEKQQKKKILHITDAFGVGGTERLLVGVINELTDFEHHLMILGGDEDLLGEIRAEIPFVNLGSKGMVGAFSKRNRVRRYIKDHGIDLVHSHLFTSCILSRLATPAHIPLFNSIHSIPSLDIYRGKKWILWLDRLTYKNRHHVVAVSQAVLRDLDKYIDRRGKAYVLYNYIEDKFRRRPEGLAASREGLKLVSVGNLRPPKNYPFVLEAFRSMPAGVSLDIYGEGNMRQELQKEIDKHSLPVRLCGTCKDIDLVLPGYDAFLMSSLYEGFGIALFEAMASGLPAILSDIPVFREVTAGNALFYGLDDPGNLVSTVKGIMDSRGNLDRLSAKGLEYALDIGGKSRHMRTLREIYYSNL